MKLEKLLLKNSSAIQKAWLKLIFATYPDDTQRFLKEQKDQFANPVGYTLSKEIENLFKELLLGIDTERVTPILDRIIAVRAVQDFSPSQAMSFIFLLKKVIREKLEKEIRENGFSDELLSFEYRIDDLALIGFDIFMKRREKIYEIRANETKNQVSRLLERAGLICEVPKWEPNLKEGDNIS